MRAVLLGLCAVVVGLWWSGLPQRSLQSSRDAQALAALPQRSVGPMLTLPDDTPDLVVVQDGESGWFEVEPAALPLDLQIGFYGPRVFDVITGAQHRPVYCGGSGRVGKIIWVVRDGDIVRDFSFCNPRRMDVSAVRPYATSVEMVEQQLTPDEIRALRRDIAQDDSRTMVSGPQSLPPYTQRYVLTPPLMWYITGAHPTQLGHEAEIEDALLAQLGEAQVSFRSRVNTNPNLTFPETATSGMMIQHGGGSAMIPGVWGRPAEIWIDCAPAGCANIASLDFAGMFEAGRNMSGLRAAMRNLVPDPSPETTPTPVSWFPTMAELEDNTVRLADPVPITYQVRYIQRP